MQLQGTMAPDQIISLFEIGGATFAMGDHDDHIHVGFKPLFGPNPKLGKQALAVLKPGQWSNLIDAPPQDRQPAGAHQAVQVRAAGQEEAGDPRPPGRVEPRPHPASARSLSPSSSSSSASCWARPTDVPGAAFRRGARGEGPRPRDARRARASAALRGRRRRAGREARRRNRSHHAGDDGRAGAVRTRRTGSEWLAQRGPRRGGRPPRWRVLNRAMQSHRRARADPNVHGCHPRAALVVRIGYGTGEAVADGRFAEAWELPGGQRRARGRWRRPRSASLRCSARGRRSLPCEELVLRARADLPGPACVRPRSRRELQSRVSLRVGEIPQARRARRSRRGAAAANTGLEAARCPALRQPRRVSGGGDGEGVLNARRLGSASTSPLPPPHPPPIPPQPPPSPPPPHPLPSRQRGQHCSSSSRRRR